MNKRINQIGFSQRVRLEWLEQTANFVLAGNDKKAVNDALQDLLKDKVSIGGQAERCNRDKMISILMKVWFKSPPDLEDLRSDGLKIIRELSPSHHLAIHWGMIMAVYPFWASVADHVGRLLRLQRAAAAMHVQRRMREQYGERETVSRSTRRVLRSYVDWGVISETGTKGIYTRGLSLIIDDFRLVSWLIEASLHTRSNRSAMLKDLVESPRLFPFCLKQITAEGLIATSSRLDVLRQGLNEELVMLLICPNGKKAGL
jgi:hypothetical protein